MSNEVFQRVAGLIAQAAELPNAQELKKDTPLVGSGICLDSASVLELLVSVEKEFAIELDPEELLRTDAILTVGAFASFVESKVKDGHAR